MNDSLWKSAIAEISRVVRLGGWVELLEVDFEYFRWGIGPYSQRLRGLVRNLSAEKGIVGDLSVYLPALLKDAGFLEVENEDGEIKKSGCNQNQEKLSNGYNTEDWRDLCMGMKGPIVQGGGYGVVNTGEEYEALLESSALEWETSKEANTSFHAILARKQG
ncbi:hypothetical protein J3R30DRAFT_3414889 [Lentinula aciculospora]|uniref:Uncharacterized protein n=1 Tax=Lentinula aciculospora TaxID=153920 RepID=A0A9W8ZT50_9AGAR|nr:hypothetical protein J3R30DRAFT_3414889 [Lentinula aciculospora]